MYLIKSNYNPYNTWANSNYIVNKDNETAGMLLAYYCHRLPKFLYYSPSIVSKSGNTFAHALALDG